MPAFATLPDPARSGSLDELVEQLRLLKVWAGDPSYDTIKDRINADRTAAGRPASELTIKSTVANCFQPGRRRLNTDLVLAIVEALHPDRDYVTRWRHAFRVVSGEIEAVSQVRVEDKLPPDLAGFTGRSAELDRLRRARRDGAAVVVSAIEGMAGIGKTQLAVHAGHRLHAEEPFEQVLFVNLRGFHPDPTQPPADPGAVLDGFLRLLGMPGHQIPYGLAERAAAYRALLAGVRALIVLDNAATADQVRPLLPASPGSLTLVTSRRSLAGLEPGTRLAVDVFSPAEAAAFLAQALPGSTESDAIARITHRCGHLPLALGLIAGHIRNTTGWTLTDHADRLDERHRQQRLDTGVELALDLSYRHLPADRQRLLRLAALHPGQDFDAYAAAALAGAGTGLDDLLRDHLLQERDPGRYTFHDLVRAYAISRSHDEDRPAERRAALTRLFDHYLATAAAAMNTLFPADAHLRQQLAGTPAPDLAEPDAARAWLDTERPTLVAVAEHTAAHGWPGHTVRLARILTRYLSGGHHTDALTVNGHAHRAARAAGDRAGQANALIELGYAELRLGRHGPAADHLRQAGALFRQDGNQAGQARALYNLGIVEERSGRYPTAIDHQREALELYRRAGDRAGEGHALSGLGSTLEQAGRLPEAIDCYRQTLTLARETGDERAEAFALHGLADVEVQADRHGPAQEHLQHALSLYRQLGDRASEAGLLDSLGTLNCRAGRLDEAAGCYQRAVTILREIGIPDGEAWARNGLGEVAHAAGRHADAVAHHDDAGAIATEIGARDQQARAHAGLGHAHRALGDHGRARDHYQRAVVLYTDLGVPQAEQISALLGGLNR